MIPVQFLDRGDGVRLACRYRPGRGPAVMFLPGYMSDMLGTKAAALDAWAAARGRACLRFDYSGCGESEGGFADGTITRWAADARAVATLAPGRLVLVGSSMGGWIALRLALEMADRVAALIGIAPAPDFTEWGLALSADDRAALAANGRIERPSDYSAEPYVYTRAFIEDGARAAVLGGPIALDAPVRLLHGQQDAAVPWQLSLTLAELLRSPDVQVTLVKDGDHRLSRDADLALLTALIDRLPEE